MFGKVNIFILVFILSAALCAWITGCGDDTTVIYPLITPTATPLLTNLTITGTVLNNGVPVPFAYVRLYRETGLPREIESLSLQFITAQTTGNDGRYIFSNLSSGTYRVEAWLSKSLYDSGQSATGAINTSLSSPGTVTVNIINGQVAPTPTVPPTSTPAATATPTVTTTPGATATPTAAPTSGTWNPVIQ